MRICDQPDMSIIFQKITETTLTEEEIEKGLTATAYHEAGHAVMAVSLGRPIEKVTISPSKSPIGAMNSGLRLGVCKIQKGRSKPTKDLLEDEVMILYAGMVAESGFTKQYCEIGAAQDLRQARRLLERSRTKTQRQLEKLEQRLLDKTEHALNDKVHLAAIELVAKELLEKKTISGRAVEHFFKMAQQQHS